MKIADRTKTYSLALTVCLGLIGAGLSGCETSPAAYGPKTADTSTGYTDERLAQNRYRVTYLGNSRTPRATVENYLLFRAAQVSLDSGFAGFEFDTRDTKAHTTYYSTFDGGWPGWGGFHRGFGWYWHSWPYDGLDEARPVTRFEAYAEVVMLTPDQLKAEPRALDARDVIAHLGPSVLPPPPPPPAK